jgi:diguanylate cyclase (GGDEF)-like protein
VSPPSTEPAAFRERPTLGVLAGWQIFEGTTCSWFLDGLLRGINHAARELDCDVLLACGIASRIGGPADVRPAWPVPARDVDFVPVGPWNTDGIVVLSPVRTEARRQYVRQLKAQGHPMVFVGAGDGLPSVEVDSAAGIRQALEHLRSHGHQRVAFVAGDPQDVGDSALRLQAFRRVARESGLELNEELVAHGSHSELGGYQAMREILDRGRLFTAVIASNDLSAIGAMRALSESGLHVPGDVAVVGFDDHLMASAHVPPLTSVRYPLAEAGWRAVEVLVELILGGKGLPDTVPILPTLVPRRSCGCLPTEPTAGSGACAPALVGGVEAIAAEMTEAVRLAGSQLKTAEAVRACQRLVSGLREALTESSSAPFERALIELLQRAERSRDSAHRWQAALSCLRRLLAALPEASARPDAAEELLHYARIALSESASRLGARQRLRDAEQADQVSALVVPLQSAQSEQEVVELLGAHAPSLGARPVCLALYEGEQDRTDARSRVLLLGEPGSPAPGESHRLTRQILPSALPASATPRSIVVAPLVHKGGAHGFVALEMASLEPCASIVRPLAVALESVRLQTAVRALTVTDELTGLHNRRFFESELRREAERSQRFGRCVGLAIVDVDHFKRYNDTYGHRAGDEALRRVAACLLAAARRVDAVTRYGGEEFAIVLAETDVDGARTVAERMRRAVEERTDFLCPLTVSVGVAVLCGPAIDPEALVLAADAALYGAKGQGRNRVCLAG